MTVRINKPALNLREELTKAQGVVRYEQRQFWMDGLVENGTFDNGTEGWGLISATLSVVSGKLRISNSGNTYGYVWQSFPTEVGKKYVFSLDYTKGTSASASMRVGTSQGGAQLGAQTLSSNGSYSVTFTATTTTTYILVINLVNVDEYYTDIDNVKVFEVDENDNVIHSLPLGFKPLHVYEDGLIQREGDVHDYTVVKTGGAYAIKPAVQPTTTTETCIIAEREL